MNDWWLKPIMVVLAVFAFVVLLINLPNIFPDVAWATINPEIISIMPWLIAFGLGIVVLYQVLGRK